MSELKNIKMIDAELTLAWKTKQGYADCSVTLEEHDNRIRADERTKTIEKFVTMHNKCNTDLCDKVGKGISCCECVAERLKAK